MARDFVPASAHTIDYGDHAEYDFGSNKISVSFLLNNDNWTPVAGYVNKRASGAAAYSVGQNYNAAGEARLFISLSTIGVYYISTSGFSTGVWYQFVVSYNGSNSAGSRCAMYKDGAAQSVTNSTDANVTLPDTAAKLVLGRVNESGTLYFDGRMAEVAIWNADLSASEAAVLGARFSPLFVKPQNLVFYDPLIRTPGDRISGYIPTTSTAVTDHPAMRYPAPSQSRALVVPVTFNPVWAVGASQIVSGGVAG